MIKIGIIGLGGMALGVHIPCLERMENVKIISVCEQNPLRLNETAGKIKATPYTDYKKMLSKEELDGVYVLTHPDSHADITIAALRRKINVFCEKPPAITLKDASLMAEEALKNKRILFFGLNRRFSPLYLKLKQISDKYGPNVLLIEKVKTPLEWKNERMNACGSLGVGDGIHLTDLARWICGEIKEVYIKSRKAGNITDCNNDTTALFVHKNNARTVLILNHFAGEHKERVVLHSDKISAEVLFAGEKSKVRIIKEGSVQDEGERIFADGLEAGGFLEETRCFIDCIREKKAPPFSPEEGIKSFELAMEFDKSGRMAES